MAKYQVITINCGGADCSVNSNHDSIEAAIKVALSLRHDDCCDDTNHHGNGDEFAEANVIVAEDDLGRTFAEEPPQVFSRILPYRVS